MGSPFIAFPAFNVIIINFEEKKKTKSIFALLIFYINVCVLNLYGVRKSNAVYKQYSKTKPIRFRKHFVEKEFQIQLKIWRAHGKLKFKNSMPVCSLCTYRENNFILYSDMMKSEEKVFKYFCEKLFQL